jgi:hypothetical protein
MLTSRITTRAAVMASVGLLVAGTAAAAAGGAIPSPFHAARAHIASAPASSDGTSTTVATEGATTSIADGTSTTVRVVRPGGTEPGGSEPQGTGPESSDPHGSDPATSDGPHGSVPAGVPTDGRHHGLCEAWTHGDHKQPNPAFGSLGTDAQHNGTTVDQFCADVLARWNHDHGTLPPTTTTVTGDTVTPTDPSLPLHPQGPPSTLPHPKGPPITIPHQGPPTSMPPISVPSNGGPGQGGSGQGGSGQGGPGHGGPPTTVATNV